MEKKKKEKRHKNFPSYISPINDAPFTTASKRLKPHRGGIPWQNIFTGWPTLRRIHRTRETSLRVTRKGKWKKSRRSGIN